MPLNFVSRSGSAVDVDNKIMIPPPRILPADIPASRNDTEYQYSIYSNGNRVDGLGFLGSDHIQDGPNGEEWVFLLDLTHEGVINSMLGRIKKSLNNTDDDFTFLQGLAEGLVIANENLSNSKKYKRYLAVTDRKLLDDFGIFAPEIMSRNEHAGNLGNTQIILAENFISASSDETLQ